MERVRAWVAVLIPDRVSRSFFWLLAGTAVALAITGPFVGAIAYFGAVGTPLAQSYVKFAFANIVAVSIGLTVIALLLRRRTVVGLSLRSALGFTLIFTLGAGVIRFLMILLLRVGRGDGNSYLNSAIQLTVILLMLGIIIGSLTFAAARETALESSFLALTRSQQALLHEEEAVRGRVFDQLHGTVQAEIVSVRRSLLDLSDSTSDPHVKTSLAQIEQQLDMTYQTSIRSIAVALSPASLDAGLLPAIRELAVRVQGATTLNLEVDPLVTVLDDPTHGGLHRQLRGAAFRIVEEAVSNAMRHSQAREITVAITTHLQDATPQLTMAITHETSVRPTIVEGEGLRRMRTRVETLGGELILVPQDRQLQVIVRIPLVHSAEGRVLGSA